MSPTVHTFRDPRAVIACPNCSVPLVGLQMDKGDFLYVYTDQEHPHSVWKKEEAADA